MSAQLDIDDACSPHPVAKSELDQLRAENAKLHRLIRDVAIAAFTRIEHGAGGCYSEWAAKAKAQLQEAVK